MSHFALLNASHEKEPASRNFRREVDATLTEFDVRAGELPETDAVDAMIITGSPASVHDDEPWINALEAWVATAIDNGTPALGICFGQQVLADVLGGEVESTNRYEIGYHMIHHDLESRLLSGIDEWFTAFTAHSDEVVELPSGAKPIAENNFSVHGFRKDHVFAVQFHPAFDKETAETVLEYKDISETQIEHVLEKSLTTTIARSVKQRNSSIIFVNTSVKNTSKLSRNSRFKSDSRNSRDDTESNDSAPDSGIFSKIFYE